MRTTIEEQEYSGLSVQPHHPDLCPALVPAVVLPDPAAAVPAALDMPPFGLVAACILGTDRSLFLASRYARHASILAIFKLK